MKREILTLSDCVVGSSYWVVNGAWEFKVLQITELDIIVRPPSWFNNLTLKKTDVFQLYLLT
jgi:hypothetical protein